MPDLATCLAIPTYLSIFSVFQYDGFTRLYCDYCPEGPDEVAIWSDSDPAPLEEMLDAAIRHYELEH